MISSSEFESLCSGWSTACAAMPGPWGGLRWRCADGVGGASLCSVASARLPCQPDSGRDGGCSGEEDDGLGLDLGEVATASLWEEWTGSITVALHPTYQVPTLYIRLWNSSGEPACGDTLNRILRSMRPAGEVADGPPCEWMEEELSSADGPPALCLQHGCDIPRLLGMLGRPDPLYLLRWFCAVGPRAGVRISPQEFDRFSRLLLAQGAEHPFQH